jgi:predicted RNA-binding protein Jag
MKTAVDFMASELLYLDNECDMKLIVNENEYQAKRKEIIDQANKMFEEQIKKAFHKNSQKWFCQLEAEKYYKETFKSE